MHPFFVPAIFIGDNCRVAGLSAGGRQGQYHGHGQEFFRAFTQEEIPDIPFIGYPCGNGFGGISGAAASYGQNKIDIVFPAQFNALPYQGSLGLGCTPPNSMNSTWFSRRDLTTRS